MKHDVIKKSHQHNLEKGVAKHTFFPQKMLYGNELQTLFHRKSLLIKTSMPFMRNLRILVEDSGFVVILTDEQGCILQIDGDSDIMQNARLFDMVPGAYMAEDSVGTNAMILAIKEDRPIQLTAQEHFINAYHRWTCSSAPIHAPDGSIVGTLNLMGQKQKVHSHTLALIVATINSIEKEFKNFQLNSDLSKTTAYLNAIINNLSFATLAVNIAGVISKVNRSSEAVFGLHSSKLSGQPIHLYIARWQEIWQIVQTGGKILDEEVTLENIPNSGRFVMSAMPIIAEIDQMPDQIMQETSHDEFILLPSSANNASTIQTSQLLLGAVLTIRDMKRVYNMVNKFGGMKAYYTFDDIIGQSKLMKQTIDFAKGVSDSPTTILITGESGTGKEVFAQAIHNASSRQNFGFVAVNCGAIPESLFESELFGYEEGAFTGARKGGKPGKFEMANGGTLFLDEVGEMPLDMQVKLLRVLQEGVLTRVGGNKSISVDVRVIAATNKNLKTLVEENKFRIDLYYRLSVIPIKIPPLRERKEDIQALIEIFLKSKSMKLNKVPPILNEEITTILLRYEWPGNVRELENFIEKTVNLDGRIMLDVENEQAFRNKYLYNIVDSSEKKSEKSEGLISFQAKQLEEIEKEAIIQTLQHCSGNKSHAAKILNISRNTLYLKTKQYGIS